MSKLDCDTKNPMLPGTAVIVSTSFAAILFGYVVEYIPNPGVGATFTLRNVSQVLYWDTSVGGFFGLASLGPSKECKIGTLVEEGTFHSVTCHLIVAPKALKVWQNVH